jgi:hypothetical protein
MLNNYESYRKRYFEAVDQSLPVSIARSRFEMEDVMRMHDRVERDALDGTIDDIQLKTAYTKEIKDAIAALCDTLQRLESTDSATPEGR